MFLGDIERDQWHEISLDTRANFAALPYLPLVSFYNSWENLCFSHVVQWYRKNLAAWHWLSVIPVDICLEKKLDSWVLLKTNILALRKVV